MEPSNSPARNHHLKQFWAFPSEGTSLSQWRFGAEDKTRDCGQLPGGLRPGLELPDGTVANAWASGPMHLIPVCAHTADFPLYWGSYIASPLLKARFPGWTGSITMTVC